MVVPSIADRLLVAFWATRGVPSTRSAGPQSPDVLALVRLQGDPVYAELVAEHLDSAVALGAALSFNYLGIHHQAMAIFHPSPRRP